MFRPDVRGFTLVELSVVLVVMALIVGAVVTASDLMRHAAGQRIFTDFISGWKSAYIAYTTQKGHVPGDDGAVPSGKINGTTNKALCNDFYGLKPLTSMMLEAGIEIPAGRGAGKEDLYVYQDGNGLAHNLKVCLVTVPWAVPGKMLNDYVVVDRHVILFEGMTIELALQIDALVDGASDARFGKFRSALVAGEPSIKDSVPWPAVSFQVGEDKVSELSTFLLLN